jgi:hypothetical protein
MTTRVHGEENKDKRGVNSREEARVMEEKGHKNQQENSTELGQSWPFITRMETLSAFSRRVWINRSGGFSIIAERGLVFVEAT